MNWLIELGLVTFLAIIAILVVVILWATTEMAKNVEHLKGGLEDTVFQIAEELSVQTKTMRKIAKTMKKEIRQENKITTAPLTFRLYQSIKFNRPIDREKDCISPGGYEMTMKVANGETKSISFDFEDYEGAIDKDDPSVIHCMQKNPDYVCFPDLNTLTAYMLHNIVSIDEWFIFTGEIEDIQDGETPLIPIEIRKAVFEVIQQDGTITQIPITVNITPESNFSNN